ncbi:rRNA maturation RNase YbeY [Calothrix sp. NIES-3974]|uniref:rRNA maturation RNase YbeY n=1 Tax=Calothrix sp. NIES-3974 TaxID=2005462 RepID=UPI000B5FE987|nr:rRNA maturation RNase YbeY [Calothrix sp. NIES-3974]BAZ06850.1 hypothetical protein NIES3974_35120 [Calothrix sp. NIES-3974]
MLVELYVQDAFYESTDEKQFPVVVGENYIDPVTWQNWINNWFEYLYTDLVSQHQAIALAQSYEMGLRFTDDTEIQQLNHTYRYKNQPTDVLAFASLEEMTPRSLQLPPDSPLYLGDIVVSIDTAIRQATQQGHSPADELVWLVSHGFLHLLGWDHPDAASLTRMLMKQVELLRLVGIKINIDLAEII